MATPIPLSAKNSMARIYTSTILFNTLWNITPEADLLETSNKESGGLKDYIAGLRGCKVHVEGWWDGGNNIYDNPISLQAGSVIPNNAFYVNGLASPFWSIPNMIVGPLPMSADVKDLVKYNFDANAKAAFAYPTGTSPPTT